LNIHAGDDLCVEPVEALEARHGGQIVRPHASHRRVITSGYMNR
jgi:hypothetical protein